MDDLDEVVLAIEADVHALGALVAEPDYLLTKMGRQPPGFRVGDREDPQLALTQAMKTAVTFSVGALG